MHCSLVNSLNSDNVCSYEYAHSKKSMEKGKQIIDVCLSAIHCIV